MRRRIPPQVATALGIELAYVPPPGEHVLELRAKKLKLSQKLVVSEGETKKLNARLKKR